MARHSVLVRRFLAIITTASLLFLVPTAITQADPIQLAYFNSGTTDGWVAGSGVGAALTTDVVEGPGALELTAIQSLSAGSTVASWPIDEYQDTRYFYGFIKGTSGVRVDVGVGTTRSAPLRLDGSWQAMGVSVGPDGQGTSVTVEAVDALSAGDSITMDAVLIVPLGHSTSDTSTGRTVTVNSAPFVGKGFNYWPAKIGDWAISVENFPAATSNPDYIFADPQTCQQDGRLLFPAEANLLRIALNDNATEYADEIRKCLDSFYAAGLKVLWLITPPGDLEVVEMDPELQPAYVAAFEDKIENAVELVGSHPATAFFTIGNEIGREASQVDVRNRWYGLNGVPSMLQDLLTVGKAADGERHLWGTTICCQNVQILTEDTVPALDFWGINEYSSTHSGGSFFSQITAADPRPVLITETGADRYRCIGGQSPFPGVISSCKTTGAGSGEDPAAQRTWNVDVWNTVNANLATTAAPNRAVFGATFFMWSDLWWFSASTLQELPYDQQDVAGFNFGGSGPDGVFNAEWDGVTYSQPPDELAQRPTTPAFDGLASLWTTQPVASISNPSAGLNDRTVTVTWTTSLPATSELHAGEYLVDGGAGVDTTYEKAVYRQVGYDPVFTQSHSVSYTVPLDENLCQKVIPRSFTTGSLSVTAAPIAVGC